MLGPPSPPADDEACTLLLHTDNSNGSAGNLPGVLPATVPKHPAALPATAADALGATPDGELSETPELHVSSFNQQFIESQPGVWEMPYQQTSWMSRMKAAFVVVIAVLVLMVPAM
jgi:hypothetical protein